MEFCKKVETSKLNELFALRRKLNAFIDLQATYAHIENAESEEVLELISNNISSLTQEYERVLKKIRTIFQIPEETHPMIHIFEDGSIYKEKLDFKK